MNNFVFGDFLSVAVVPRERPGRPSLDAGQRAVCGGGGGRRVDPARRGRSPDDRSRGPPAETETLPHGKKRRMSKSQQSDIVNVGQ